MIRLRCSFLLQFLTTHSFQIEFVCELSREVPWRGAKAQLSEDLPSLKPPSPWSSSLGSRPFDPSTLRPFTSSPKREFPRWPQSDPRRVPRSVARGGPRWVPRRRSAGGEGGVPRGFAGPERVPWGVPSIARVGLKGGGMKFWNLKGGCLKDGPKISCFFPLPL